MSSLLYVLPISLHATVSDINNTQVVKRTMQLTGIHIPDSSINVITNVGSLLEKLVQRPKLRKLAQELPEAVLSRGLELPNVKFMPRKITEIDRETEVGRWKVIKAELKRKGLPVYPDKRGIKWRRNPTPQESSESKL